MESIRLDETGATTRNVSIDFTLQRGDAIDGSAGRILLPLGVVAKGTLKGLSTDYAGNPLPVLETAANATLAEEMLLAIARNALAGSLHRDPQLKALISDVVGSDPSSADTSVAALVQWLAHGGADPADPSIDVLLAMARTLGSNFLLLVELTSEVIGSRSIVKYCHEEGVPRNRGSAIPTQLSWDVPHFGMAASWHMELGALPGVRIPALVVQEQEPDGSPIQEWEDVEDDPLSPLSVAHVACTPTHRFTTAKVAASLKPSADGLITVAVVGATLVWLVVALGVFQRRFPGVVLHEGASVSGSSASILLAGPALLLSWLARTPEHFLVARVLRPVRRVIACSAFALLGLAALIAVPIADPARCIAWATLAGGQTWALLESWEMWSSVRRTSYSDA